MAFPMFGLVKARRERVRRNRSEGSYLGYIGFFFVLYGGESRHGNKVWIGPPATGIPAHGSGGPVLRFAVAILTPAKPIGPNTKGP